MVRLVPATGLLGAIGPWAQVPDANQDDGGGLIDAAVSAAVPGGLPAVGVPGVGGLASGISDGLLTSLEARLDEALVTSATKVHAEVFGFLDSSTTIDLASLRGGGPLAMTTGIGVTMVLLFFFAAIVRGLLRGEYSAIIRAALVDVPLALVGTIGLVTFAQLLLGVTDAATAALLDSTAADLGEANLLGGQGLLGAFVLLVYIVAALLTWLWLFMRAALIYFVIAAAPLGLATRAFPPAAVFARRTIEMAVALILSKFFLAIALSLGASYFNASAGLSTMLVSAALMVLAAFMPSVVLKLIPIAEGATAAAGVERAPLRMAAAAGGIAIAAGTFGGGAAVAGGASAGGSPAPGTGPSGGNGGGGSPGTQPTGGPSLSPSGGSSGSSSGGLGASGGSGSGGASGGVSVAAIGGGGVGRVSGTPNASGGDAGESVADRSGAS